MTQAKKLGIATVAMTAIALCAAIPTQSVARGAQDAGSLAVVSSENGTQEQRRAFLVRKDDLAAGAFGDRLGVAARSRDETALRALLGEASDVADVVALPISDARAVGAAFADGRIDSFYGDRRDLQALREDLGARYALFTPPEQRPSDAYAALAR